MMEDCFQRHQSLAAPHQTAIVSATSITETMKLSLLRILLRLDAAVLFLLGALLIFAPEQVERFFQFNELPSAVSYLIGLWGCALATLGIGYFKASAHPLRHVVWVQVGIARGALECLLGLFYLARGIVTFQQAGMGIIVAGLMMLAYFALYPRKPRLVQTSESSVRTASPSL
jgi:hypothetical protein